MNLIKIELKPEELHSMMRVIDITNMDVQNVINRLKSEGKATSTMRDALGRMRDCMEAAKNNMLIPINPCFEIRVPWENKQVERRFLSQEEQNIFLKAVENNWYKEMFYIMFLTGMRVGEVGGLMWSDVDFDNKCILTRFKTSRKLLVQDGEPEKDMRTWFLLQLWGVRY